MQVRVCARKQSSLCPARKRAQQQRLHRCGQHRAGSGPPGAAVRVRPVAPYMCCHYPTHGWSREGVVAASTTVDAALDNSRLKEQLNIDIAAQLLPSGRE